MQQATSLLLEARRHIVGKLVELTRLPGTPSFSRCIVHCRLLQGSHLIMGVDDGLRHMTDAVIGVIDTFRKLLPMLMDVSNVLLEGLLGSLARVPRDFRETLGDLRILGDELMGRLFNI